MTLRLLLLRVALFGLLLVTTEMTAQAQIGYPGQFPGARLPPAYSPYLNLTRQGNPVYNYYGLVRPQIDASNAIQGLQQQVHQVQQETVEFGTQQQLPPTGYSVRFLDYGRYFPGGVHTGPLSVVGQPGLSTAQRQVPTGPTVRPPARR